jgi:hypothetical protein
VGQALVRPAHHRPGTDHHRDRIASTITTRTRPRGLERRSEVGLRRALGATTGQVRTQFLSEAILLALVGGAVGVVADAVATGVYASTKRWAVVIPTTAWAGGIAAGAAVVPAGHARPAGNRGIQRAPGHRHPTGSEEEVTDAIKAWIDR